MITITMFLSLICPQTRLIDKSGTWGTPQDVQALRVAKERCRTLYGSTAPCLKQFIKTEESIYQALCGLGETK